MSPPTRSTGKRCRVSARSGAAVYEQDWLGTAAQTMPNLDDEAAYLDNMPGHCSSAGSTCNTHGDAEPFFAEHAVQQPDHYPRQRGPLQPHHWDEFLFASRLAGALGAWPWSDVFMSGETDNLLVSRCRPGQWGWAGPDCQSQRQNLLLAVRGDGVIVKPDAPLPDRPDLHQ